MKGNNEMYTIKQLCEYTNGILINGDINKKVTHYSVNHKFYMDNGFYVPIDFHGVNQEVYIIDAVRLGAMGFFINVTSLNKDKIVKEAKQINSKVCIIEVDNVNEAIYNLAKINRKKYINIPIIGITGSVGKTTMCRILSNILKKEYKLFHDFDNRNMNSKVLISSDLMHLEYYEMAVIEMATSRPGNMHILSDLVRPSIAVITTIGTAQLNNFHTKENILKDKLHIVDYLKDDKILLVNADNSLLNNIEESESYRLIKCSKNEASNIKENENGLSFEIKIYGKNTKFNLGIFGKHYITSIIMAIHIAEYYNIKYENIVDGINEFKPINGRCNILKDKKNNITLIDDSYSSSFESVKCGLDIANELKSKRKIAVLGKMAAYGDDADKLHEELGEYFSNLDFDFIYLTGDYTKHIFKGALSCFEEKKIKRFKSKELLVEDLEKNIENGDLIYIKAAHTQNFGMIVNELKKKYDLV